MKYDDTMNNANRNWELEYKAIRTELIQICEQRDAWSERAFAERNRVKALEALCEDVFAWNDIGEFREWYMRFEACRGLVSKT